MKHWNTMTELENQVYRVREFKTLLDVTTRGIAETGSDIDEVTTVLYTLLGMIENIDENLYDKFHVLWEEVRQDSWKTEEDENDSQVWDRIVDDLQKYNSEY